MDIEGRQLIDQPSDDCRLTLVKALQQEATTTEIQSLVINILETVKRNYLKQAQQDEPDAVLKQINKLETTEANV